MEARVGIGLQTPRIREKMAHLEPLLKHNPPLSGITQTYTVGVRFGVRNRWSESSGLCSVFRGNFRIKLLTVKATLPLLFSTRFYSLTTRLLKNPLTAALAGSTGHVQPLREAHGARQPRTESLLSMSESVTRSPLMTEWNRTCLGTLLLPLATLRASARAQSGSRPGRARRAPPC